MSRGTICTRRRFVSAVGWLPGCTTRGPGEGIGVVALLDGAVDAADAGADGAADVARVGGWPTGALGVLGLEGGGIVWSLACRTGGGTEAVCGLEGETGTVPVPSEPTVPLGAEARGNGGSALATWVKTAPRASSSRARPARISVASCRVIPGRGGSPLPCSRHPQRPLLTFLSLLRVSDSGPLALNPLGVLIEAILSNRGHSGYLIDYRGR
jgi:hypothetical protein